MKIKAFICAINGLIAVFKTERNFKYMTVGFMVTIVMSVILKISRQDWILVLLCSGAVLTAEIFNTVVENIVDFISPDYNLKAGLIKDMAAGAVLIISLIALVIGLIIFMPYLI